MTIRPRSRSIGFKLAAGLLAVAAFATPVLVAASRWAQDPAKSDGIKIVLSKDTDKKDPAKPMYSRSGYDITPLTPEKIAELAKSLTPDEAKVILRKGTEAPFCGNLLDNKKDGTYTCRLCGLPLFSSGHKFDSGTGWPSFFRPFDTAHIKYISDKSHGMTRVEILCARCDGHLGHVFEDGPKPTGLRYCLNSASMSFLEKSAPVPPASAPVKTATAYFAGGCFWGVEHHFQQLPGVINSVSGYMGGSIKNPTYREVCTGTTGHAETVMVTYDPARITYEALLTQFFRFHDPTTLNRQGPDVGTQYRSAIFTTDATQAEAARKFIEQQQATNKRFASRKIVTEVSPVAKAGAFYPAEDYHQDYAERHGKVCPLPADVEP